MRNCHTFSLIRMGVTAFFLLALLPGQLLMAAAQDQDTETSYTSEAYDVTITWTDAWVADPPVEAGSDLVTLERDSSIILIVTIFDGSVITPEDAVWMVMEDDDELVEDLSTQDPPRVSIIDPQSGMIYLTEAYSINDGEATVLVILTTIPVLETSAIGIAQNEVAINGSPVLTGMPLAETGESIDLTGEATAEAGRTSRTSRTTDETPEATEEATAEAGRTSRTSRTTDETPEATEEATTEVVRTSRSSTATETPEATEVVTEVATEQPTVVATEQPTEVIATDGLESYTGPLYGYTVRYDSSIWEMRDELESETADGIKLDIETGTVNIWATSMYGADPVGCLFGEEVYFSLEMEGTSNWDIASGADGEPLRYEGDDLAWGVFAYTYTSSTGVEAEFVDYISCETIPGHDAVLIVHLTSLPEEYNTNLDHVLDILDTLEFEP